jgi:hypothetical protein
MVALISNESLIPVSDAPKHVPGRPHIATIWRWIQRGCRGVRLETWLVGGRRFTSLEAIDRFIERTTAAAAPELACAVPTPRQRRRAIDQANRELDRELGPVNAPNLDRN